MESDSPTDLPSTSCRRCSRHLTMEDIENFAHTERGGRWSECQTCFTRCMIHNIRPGCYSCSVPARYARIEKKIQDHKETIAALKELGYEIQPSQEKKP